MIHMQQNSSEFDYRLNLRPFEENTALYEHTSLQYVIGNSAVVAGMVSIRPLDLFNDGVLDFFNDLSKKLLKFGREYSDVATFGFWCRKAALLKEKEKYDDIACRLGKGVVFHSTPSNVPVNFAFSFATGLLAGNANIVRIPGKPFEQVKIITDAVRELVETSHFEIAPYVAFVKYLPNKEITDTFCAISNTRVVWGGDGTISEMRQSQLRPRANEITFADRHSITVIDADGYLNIDDKAKVALAFYNDTYFSDQNACTAPRVIVWLGKNIKDAQTEFWTNVHTLVREKYTIAPVQAVGKLTAFYKTASQVDTKLVYDSASGPDQLITRVEVSKLDGLMKYKYNSGFFFEYNAECIDEIMPLCDERCQTMTYCGIDKNVLINFIKTNRPRGVDRAVPIGESMNFELIWDGHDLVREMSRYIKID